MQTAENKNSSTREIYPFIYGKNGNSCLFDASHENYHQIFSGRETHGLKKKKKSLSLFPSPKIGKKNIHRKRTRENSSASRRERGMHMTILENKK
jgi:hypothetical protein